MPIPIPMHMQGEECVATACVTCTACSPGYYKAAVSTEACGPCPVNTYGNNLFDQTSSGYCTQCPFGSNTGGHVASTSADACQCGDRFYLTSAGATGSALSCATCPSGAVCPFSGFCALRTPDLNCTSNSGPIPGTWVLSTSGEDAGKYRLIGCPAGYQTQNASHDTAKCHPCLETQYIINPDKDACERCPPGLICQGDDMYEEVVENSTWAADNGVYRLATCPRGYARRSIDDGTSSADQQQCIPCAAGSECVLEVCNNYTCSECQEGTYKDAAGTQACRACPQNTFNPKKGATAFAECEDCQPKSSTAGSGHISWDDCECDRDYYLIMSNQGTASESRTCQACPRGARCADGRECALRNDGFNCSDQSQIVGNWSLETSGQYIGHYVLTSCPKGYAMRTTFEDLQECFKCPTFEYILRSNQDECRTCPLGLRCKGDDTLEPVTINSSWVKNGSVFKLESCPSGYSAVSINTEGVDAADQECVQCGKVR